MGLEVPRESIHLGREIGNGNFSNVMEALMTDHRGVARRVAAKVAVASGGEEDGRMLYMEAMQMRDLHHANVVALVGVCFASQPCMLLLELMDNGDLRTYLRLCADDAMAPMTQGHLLALATDAASGVSYLHAHRYVHRDIAARNVVLSEGFVAKIGDFGLCSWRYH